MILTYSRRGKTYEADTDKMPRVTVDYLLLYGFRQSLQDAAAGVEKAVRLEYTDLKVSHDELAAAIEQALDGMILKRLDAIKNGTVGQRHGQPRLSELKSTIRIVALKMLKAGFKGANLPWPKDAEKVEQLVRKIITKHGDQIMQEAQEIIDRAKALPIINLDELNN